MKSTEERTEIYYKRDLAFAREQQHMQKWNGSNRNQELIQTFQEYLFAKSTGQNRVAKLTYILRYLCDLLPCNLDESTKAEIQTVVAHINKTNKWAEDTKNDYRRTLKQFYTWYEDDDPRLWNGNKEQRHHAMRLYRYLEKDVRRNTKLPQKEAAIITEDDIRTVLQKGTQRPLERAILAVLHETGARVGELLNMRLQDLERRGKHAMVRLNGKTGERRVPIIKSLPYLNLWLQDHPDKDNPRSLIWISKSNKYYGKPLRYYGIRRILERCFKRADVTKDHNPHWFRHSRATLLSTDYSDVLRCKIMGWSIGSKQVKTYTKLAAVDVEEKFLQQHGLASTQAPEQKIQECVCCTINTNHARYCYKCGQPLNIKVAMQEQEYLAKAFEVLPKILADPELKKRYETLLTS